VLLAVVAALLMACTGGGGSGISGALTIFASPSLTDAFNAMIRAFTSSYPGVTFQTVFEPDSVLASRAAAGPAPDLIAAEDPATLVAAGATSTPVHFAQGQIVLAVRTGNPAHVSSLADLTRAGVRVALCQAAQPCGRVTEAVLAAAQVTAPETALREPDVRSALRHVTDGTADAALVYRSDAYAAGSQVIVIEVPFSAAALAQFVAVVPEGAHNPRAARTFLDYLASPAVSTALTQNGFRPVDGS
jgi:molybdate transport system substrate-binding protein